MLLSVGYRHAYFNAFLRFGQEMNKIYKLEIPRFISAVLAAKSPGEQFPRRGWWFVGEKAGERVAVNRIPTLQERRAMVICLQKDVSAITAQELGEVFDLKPEKSPKSHFYETLSTLAKLKIARFDGEELGEQIQMFSSIGKKWGRVDWTFSADYLRWMEQTPRQEIKYPVIGMNANLKKNPMANMLMLSAAEWYSMNKRDANGRFMPVWFAMKYYPDRLPNVLTPLQTAIDKFGFKCPDLTTQGGGSLVKLQIDISQIFPEPPKRRRKKGKKIDESKGGKSQDIQLTNKPPKLTYPRPKLTYPNSIIALTKGFRASY